MNAALDHLAFLIDNVDGGIQIDTSSRLSRSTTLTDFWELPIAAKAEGGHVGNGWMNVQVRLGPFDALFVILRLVFDGSSLREIHLVLSEGAEANSWADWSEGAEMKRKEFHDDWLLKSLGPGPYSFEWGEVLSVYDDKGGCSEIIIRFA